MKYLVLHIQKDKIHVFRKYGSKGWIWIPSKDYSNLNDEAIFHNNLNLYNSYKNKYNDIGCYIIERNSTEELKEELNNILILKEII